MRRIGPLLLVLACMACVPTAAEAQDPWRPVVTSCVTAEGVAGCAPARAIAGAWNTTITADGRTAYVAGFSTGAIGVFDRDPATGALKQKPGASGCIRNGGGDGCATGRGFSSPDGIAVAPDGVRVHVSTWNGGSSGSGAAVLRRDRATGALSQRAASESCIAGSASATCLDGHGFGGATGSLAASPDGAHLYVGVNPVAVVRSSPSGILSQDPGLEGCVSTPAQDGCTGVLGLGTSGRQPVVAPDGRQVYVPSGDGIAVLDRNAATGALSQRDGGKGCLVATAVAGCTTEPRVAGVIGLVIDREGRHVYATSSRGMITLARAADGSLSVQGCVRDVAIAGCTRGTSVANLDYAAISPDGHDVVASSFAAALIAFRRDPATGALVQRPGIDGCITTDGRAPGQGAAGACRAHPAIGSDAHVAFGSDSHLYGGGFDTASVATVKRDFAPVCADTAVPVPHATATPVRLACSDRNGDPIALSVADAPRSGSLGAIDQGAGSVLYGPFGGFTGPDAFTFRGTAAGLTSAPARAALDVAAPAPAAAPPLGRVTSSVTTRWGVRGKRIFLLALAVRQPPSGARLELRCAGSGRLECPFGKRAAARRSKGSITLFKPLAPARATRTRARSFRAGQTLQVRVTAPGRIGKVVVFRLRRGKIPTGAQRCLPPGAQRPQRRC